MDFPATTLFYYSIAVMSSLLAYSYSRVTEVTLRNLILSLIFLILVVPASLRFEIGRDYGMYEDLFEKVSAGRGFSKEVGYFLLSKGVLFFGGTFKHLIALVAIITNYFVLLTFVKMPRKFAPMYLILYALIVYLNTYNILRQLLALVIVNYALFQHHEQPKVKTWFYMLLAFSIHYSSAIVIILYLFRKVKISYPWLLLVVFVLAGVSYYYGLAAVVINNIPDWIPYAAYTQTKFNAQTELGSGLGLFFSIISAVIPLFYAKRIVKQNPQYAVWYLCLFAYIVASILSAEIRIFNRLRATFVLTMIYAWCITLEHIELKWLRQSYFIVLIMLNLIVFHMTAAKAYVSLHKGVAVVPYKTFIKK